MKNHTTENQSNEIRRKYQLPEPNNTRTIVWVIAIIIYVAIGLLIIL